MNIDMSYLKSALRSQMSTYHSIASALSFHAESGIVPLHKAIKNSKLKPMDALVLLAAVPELDDITLRGFGFMFLNAYAPDMEPAVQTELALLGDYVSGKISLEELTKDQNSGMVIPYRKSKVEHYQAAIKLMSGPGRPAHSIRLAVECVLGVQPIVCQPGQFRCAVSLKDMFDEYFGALTIAKV